MNDHIKSVVETCDKGAESNALNFLQILDLLAEAGVESYFVDYRRATKIFYLPDGESVELSSFKHKLGVAEKFDAAKVGGAVGQSQRGEHTYKEFCEKVVGAGCAGYFVSILGKRVVYFGRTGETHVELMPAGK